MSAEYPIIRGKRPGSPNEVNNSFIKNVTSRVSSLLPSTITKWFSSPSSSNANGSAPVVESSASSSEDEDQITQPPAKRARFSSASPITNHIVPKTRCTGTNTDFSEAMSVVKSPSVSQFKSGTSFASTPLSSAGEENLEHEKDTSVHSQSSYTIKENKSIIKKRKSLFDIPNNEKVSKISPKSSPLLDYSQPKYKPSLLGSPFYSGKTRYGGAGSPYMNLPNIKQKKDTVVNKPAKNDSVTVSQSARYIMDLLENYSSPLIEAKRISQCQKCTHDTSNSSKNDVSPSNSSKYQELYVPSYAKILRLKQRSRLNDTTSAARQIFASHSSSPPFAAYPDSKSLSDKPTKKTDKLTTKMKTNLTRINRDNVDSGTNISDSVNLPAAVLQIDPNNLPNFTLNTSKTETTSKTTISMTPTQITTNANTSTGNSSAANFTAPIATTTVSVSADQLTEQDSASVNETESSTSEIVYNFSSPNYIHFGTVQNSQILNYPFNSPERQLMKQSKEKESPQSKSWTCDDCCASKLNVFDKCICCGIKKPSTSDDSIKKCSVCKALLSQENLDKCLDCEKKIDKVEESGSEITQLSKWKCQDCWVNNDESVDKCVCCGGNKPYTVSSIANRNSNNVESEWRCDICLIKNKNSAEKCIACGGAKPVATQSNTKVLSSLPSTGNISTSTEASKTMIVPQSGKWECQHCLVRNDKDRSKCVCCDGEKPGTVKENEYKKFNFGQVPNTFKFGIDPNQNSSNKKSEPEPTAQSESTFKELESNNNNVSKPATFTFGIPKQNPVNSLSVEKTTTEETPKPTFTFGLSKPVSAPSNKSTLESLETEETIQEVPNVIGPNTSIPENTARPMGLFEINTPATATTAPITFGQTEKIATVQAKPAVTTAPVDAAAPQSTFSFSASGIKPGLFSSVVTAPATTNISFPSVQTPATSSISYFQKSEPVPTTSVQFFSKTDPKPSSLSLFNKNYTLTTTEAPAPAPVSNVPVFSFGSSNQNPQAEKPKFNFSFGNKSETPSLFSLPNNGSILSGNNLPSDNISSGNIMSGGNSLATPNPIGGNNMPINSLSSGLLTGAKKENLMWPSNNDSSSISMSSGNTIEQEQGINNAPAIQTSNPFSIQAKKENTWWTNQNTSNNSLGSLKVPTGTANSVNNSVGAAQCGMFGAQEKKDNNVWSLNTNNNTSSNIFVPAAGGNSVQKPAAFSFASSMQFNSNNMSPSTTFGSPAQPSQNMFGMSSQVNNNQPAMFSSNLQNQTPQNIFGAQATNNTAPAIGMFGTPNTSSTLFGSPPSSIPTFDAASSVPTVPTPTFNFGAHQTTGVFGFGQQNAPSQPGVYNFGAGTTGSLQRQFNIGTAGGTSNALGQRRIKRAVRRNTPR